MNISKTIPFIILAILLTQCQTTKNNENLLIAPDGWKSEIIAFPLSFAPDLQYTGNEHVRFTPEWANKDSNDYFSYVFLWNIDQKPNLSAEKLENELEEYYDGLMQSVSKGQNIEVPIKSKAFFEQLNESSFVGKVLTYDAFITKDKVNLNIIVNYSFCEKSKKYQVLFKISPQTPEHAVWKKLDKVSLLENCR
ncbi:hypothetical protein [Aquimarina algicola]|uniref:Uncharacterized protein n=1 Tax=Aquimarina algicola TaxID=2589995 RepID=A0A504JJM4_9FLAO|nr:hypothetical protein [Aquimarina algicola]TPN88992.1 hypothetical protein FHK87_01875 [Aquimarina algicola]